MILKFHFWGDWDKSINRLLRGVNNENKVEKYRSSRKYTEFKNQEGGILILALSEVS